MAHRKLAVGNHKYYRVQITTPDGSRKTLYGKTMSELRAKELEFRKEMKAEAKAGRSIPTVKDYAMKQLALIRPTVKENTYAGYESKVRNFILPSLGHMKISDVKIDDIRSTLNPLQAQSSSSYHLTHMLLRRIFGAAKKNHLIKDDPTEDVSAKGGNPPKMVPSLTDEQIEILKQSVRGLSVECFIMIALYSGLRREEILALRWDCVKLSEQAPYIQVRHVWRLAKNRPVISSILKSRAAKRDIPIPPVLFDYLKGVKDRSSSEYVVANSEGQPLSGTQWRNLWDLVRARTTQPRSYTRYTDGEKYKRSVSPVLGARSPHNPDVIYSIDFRVTPHILRHTYITNLIHANVDPKTVQYLAGHESSKITMDIYAAVKYNRPETLAETINNAFSADHSRFQGK